MFRSMHGERARASFLAASCLALMAGGAMTTACDRLPAAPQETKAEAPAPAAREAKTKAAAAPKAAAYINISSKPPIEAPAGASTEALAKFAWEQFLALAWKAGYPATKRGQPDTNWNYRVAEPFPALMTWQTYAQTTELRPNHPLTAPWDQLGVPQYSYVALIARDPNNPGAKNNLWNNLDEDNEIGSCNIYGQYDEQPSPKKLVLFQVKVNQDEYEYVRTRFGADQQSPTGKMAVAQAKAAASIAKPPYLYYGASRFPGTCGSCDPSEAICLPCGGPQPLGKEAEGAIEVKSAWRMLEPGEPKDHFYTTEALYYDLDPKTGLYYYKNGIFALIGIHIIHKTENYPAFIFTTFEQESVEQDDMKYILLDRDSGVQTGNPVPVKRQTGDADRTALHPVSQDLDEVTKRVWEQLKNLNGNSVWLHYRLAGVQAKPYDCPAEKGTSPGKKDTYQVCNKSQEPTKCAGTEPGHDPNYFMANFSIESDPFLNNFSGPGFGNNPYGTCQNVVTYAASSGTNSSYGATLINMGGCQGCHGVAQTSFGTDFSFLLDFGNNKPAENPATLYNYTLISKLHRPKPQKHYLKGIPLVAAHVAR